MNKPVIVTNLYPKHMHHESLRVSLEFAGYELVSLVNSENGEIVYDGQAVAQFIFNYPINEKLVNVILERHAAGQVYAVMMDDPLAFFDCNINKLIVRVLQSAARVYTSTDNMLPTYNQLDVKAQLLVGLANPLFDVPEPIDELQIKYDWGFIGTLFPQRFRFFWQLKRLLPNLSFSIVTQGFDYKAVIERVRETRVNIAYGNFSDITDFKSNGTTLRAWEFPYSGAFILHDERPLLKKFFVENESIVIFKTVEECAELIKYYLAQPTERERVAQNARRIIDQYRMTDFFSRLYRELIKNGS